MSPEDNYGISQNSSQNFYQNSQQNFDTYPQNYQNSEDSYFQSYTIVLETQNSYDQYDVKDDASNVGVGRGKKAAVKKKNTGKEATSKEKIAWEKTKDEVFIASFMKHSTDAIASTNQKATQLWSKVQKSFEEAQRQRPYEIHVRNGNMLQSRWRRIATVVTKWVPTYDATTKRMSSGQNEGHVLKNAIKIYEHQHGSWDFDHAWRLLQNFNKWEELVNLREKNTESEQPSRGSGKRKIIDGGCATPETPATDDDVFGGASIRPIGIKKSKELARGKFKEDPNITNFATILQLHDEVAANRRR
ncbi:glutathione S-transferase T3-like [Impatiens glandulifera]|uniref:glutathione S-transferase T3-like n=1 Tax=Impatiens glandulifera TaxID=253017 RepID=UPI001FB13204|nr:glutathione S-transferase T3-like [Impatiens glandulifera]